MYYVSVAGSPGPVGNVDGTGVREASGTLR